MSTCRIRGAFTVGMMLAFAAAVLAQEDANRSETPRSPNYGPGGSTLITLVAKPGVQTEIGLAEPESKRLLDLLREIDPTHSAFRTPEDKQQEFARELAIQEEIKRKSEAAIQKSLSEEQFQRLQQLQLQDRGGVALLNPEIARRLALTAEQEKTLETIKEEFRRAVQASRNGAASGTPRTGDEAASTPVDKFKTDLLAVLTPEQANQWQAMTGAPFVIPKFIRRYSFHLVISPEVQKELGLADNEAAALVQSLDAIERDEGKNRDQSFRSGREASSREDRSRQSRQIVDTVKSSLTVSQWNRLQEVILQQSGMSVLAHSDVANRLGLSREQRNRVRETIDKYRQELAGNRTLLPKPGESQTRRQREQADLLDILTPEQKEQWDAMQGAKADLRQWGIIPGL